MLNWCISKLLFLDYATGKQIWEQLVKKPMLESLGLVLCLLVSASWLRRCSCGTWSASFGRRSSYRYCYDTSQHQIVSSSFGESRICPTLYSFSSCGSFHVSLGVKWVTLARSLVGLLSHIICRIEEFWYFLGAKRMMVIGFDNWATAVSLTSFFMSLRNIIHNSNCLLQVISH